MNDLVDRLAVEAAVTQRGRSGVGEPDDLGPPDRPGAGRPRPGAGQAPPGRPARPRRRAPARRSRRLRRHGHGPRGCAPRLGEVLAAMVEVDGPLTVVSGLRLGAEQLGAEAALEQGLPLVAVLPFPNPDSPWPPESRVRFGELLAAADDGDHAGAEGAGVQAARRRGHRPAGRVAGQAGRQRGGGVGPGGRRRWAARCGPWRTTSGPTRCSSSTRNPNVRPTWSLRHRRGRKFGGGWRFAP